VNNFAPGAWSPIAKPQFLTLVARYVIVSLRYEGGPVWAACYLSVLLPSRGL